MAAGLAEAEAVLAPQGLMQHEVLILMLLEVTVVLVSHPPFQVC